MKVLITNDDGVDAPQLLPLIRWCRKLGDVTVVVPKQEQSAKSHSIEIRKPMEIRQRELEPGTTVWTVDSTPADCVRFAVSGLKEHFDLVISGINRGFNLGQDTLYSGTVAAASEAIIKGIPAIALSTSIKYYDHAVHHLDSIFGYIRENELMKYHSFYNINIPVDPKGFRITRLGGASFSEEFVPQENDLYFPGGKPLHSDGSNSELDTDAMVHGFISITPMTIDRTAKDIFEKLNTC